MSTSAWYFSGISVTEKGKQRFLDPYLAYQRACLHAIDYLTKFGYSPEQEELRRELRSYFTKLMTPERAEALAASDFNISEAARRLGMHRRTLARKLEKQRVK